MSSEPRRLFFVLLIDCEPWGASGPGESQSPTHPGRYDFQNSLERTFRLLEFADTTGIPISFFVEVDKAVKDDWLLQLHDSNLLTEIRRIGDIGPHIHDWRWCQKSKRWVQEMKDEAYIYDNTKYACYKAESFKIYSRLHRRGWTFFDKAVARSLVDMNFKADFSSSPFKSMSFKGLVWSIWKWRGFFDWHKLNCRLPFYCDISGSRILMIPVEGYFPSKISMMKEMAFQYVQLSISTGAAILGVYGHNYSLGDRELKKLNIFFEHLKKMCSRHHVELHYLTASSAIEHYLELKREVFDIKDIEMISAHKDPFSLILGPLRRS